MTATMYIPQASKHSEKTLNIRGKFEKSEKSEKTSKTLGNFLENNRSQGKVRENL